MQIESVGLKLQGERGPGGGGGARCGVAWAQGGRDSREDAVRTALAGPESVDGVAVSQPPYGRLFDSFPTAGLCSG